MGEEDKVRFQDCVTERMCGDVTVYVPNTCDGDWSIYIDAEFELDRNADAIWARIIAGEKAIEAIQAYQDYIGRRGSTFCGPSLTPGGIAQCRRQMQDALDALAPEPEPEPEPAPETEAEAGLRKALECIAAIKELADKMQGR